MAANQYPLTDNDKRLRSAEDIERAVEIIRKAHRRLDGLEWAPRVAALIDEAREITGGLKRYAK